MNGINSVLEKALKTKVIEVSEQPFAKTKEIKQEPVEVPVQKKAVDPRIYGKVKKTKFTSAAGT